MAETAKFINILSRIVEVRTFKISRESLCYELHKAKVPLFYCAIFFGQLSSF